MEVTQDRPHSVSAGNLEIVGSIAHSCYPKGLDEEEEEEEDDLPDLSHWPERFGVTSNSVRCLHCLVQWSRAKQHQQRHVHTGVLAELESCTIVHLIRSEISQLHSISLDCVCLYLAFLLKDFAFLVRAGFWTGQWRLEL